jgi:hypothetical protein
MLFMATGTFPLKSAVDAGKIFVESVAKPRPYVNRVGMWMCYGDDGIKTWAVFEVEKGHEEEGLKTIINNYIPFFGVEGYKTKIEPVMKPEEALELIGLTPPA